jgi:hypothetical protein
VVIERVHVGPTTICYQYNSRIEVSNDVRVLVQVNGLGRRHVHSHRGVFELLAPRPNGGDTSTSAVVHPGGCPLHVATVRTRAFSWSCVVANANERAASDRCTCTYGRNGEHDVYHRVEVDEKEYGGHGVDEERDAKEQDAVAEQEPPQVRTTRGDDLFRVLEQILPKRINNSPGQLLS